MSEGDVSIFKERRNVVALVFLIGGLVFFGLFQVLPCNSEYEESQGWTIWEELWELVRDPSELADLADSGLWVYPFIGAIVAGSLMVPVAPFLIWFLARSAVLHWVFVGVVGMTFIGVLVPILVEGGMDDPGPGLFCLVMSPLVSLIGLFLVKRQRFGQSGIGV
jgi:hypothetical protein